MPHVFPDSEEGGGEGMTRLLMDKDETIRHLQAELAASQQSCDTLTQKLGYVWVALDELMYRESMLQMRESMLRQTLHSCITSDAQNIQPFECLK